MVHRLPLWFDFAHHPEPVEGRSEPLCTYLDHHKFGNRAGYLLSICEFYNILPVLLLKRAYEIRRG